MGISVRLEVGGSGKIGSNGVRMKGNIGIGAFTFNIFTRLSGLWSTTGWMDGSWLWCLWVEVLIPLARDSKRDAENSMGSNTLSLTSTATVSPCSPTYPRCQDLASMPSDINPR
jgi:hypothetical protein